MSTDPKKKKSKIIGQGDMEEVEPNLWMMSLVKGSCIKKTQQL